MSQRRLEAAPTMKTQADKALTRRQRREAERIAAVAGKAK